MRRLLLVAFLALASGRQLNLNSPLVTLAPPPAFDAATAVIAPEKGRGCNACIQLSGQTLSILLNYILNAGVVGGCGKLCGALNASKDVDLACNIVCDVVGIKAFIKAINNTDLDPIYFCEELKVCPAGPDSAAATIMGVSVSPQSGPVGTTFAMQVDINVLNATGVGEVRIAVSGHGQNVGQSFINEGFPVGPTGLKVNLEVKDDPSAEPPVEWFPGVYQYAFEVCQGECGSKHPHSIVFGKESGNFTITNENNNNNDAAVLPPRATKGLVLDPEFLNSLAEDVDAGTHYGDPSAGCESDEMSVQITGITGNFCTSKCSLFKACPTDVPAGVTAKPTCALSDASSGTKYCALICDPSGANTCGAATCKSISGTGVCTYND